MIYEEQATNRSQLYHSICYCHCAVVYKSHFRPNGTDDWILYVDMGCPREESPGGEGNGTNNGDNIERPHDILFLARQL